MAKGKSTAYFCSDCGYESAKWTGQCPACKSWNTMVEEPVSQIKTVGKGGTGSARKVSADTARPVMLSEIVLDEEDRIRTGFDELDRVLGSGIVRGSLDIGWRRSGIGKSTLLLQVCRNLAGQNQKITLHIGRGIPETDKAAGEQNRDGDRPPFFPV